MADVMFLVYFTCFCLYQDLVFCDEYGESGNQIKLNPFIHGKPEEILWTHNGNKVLEYDGKQMDTYGSFKDRVELDFETGQLTIIKLNNQDSGTYKSEIVISKKVHTSSHTLTVLDALPEPLVTCEVDETSNVKKLSCSVESQTEPSYEWSGSDVKQPGPTLVVNEQEENLNSVYTCTVKSKAGSRTTDFNLQDCATGRANPAVLVPVLIVILLLIILLAALAFYLYRRKRPQCKCHENIFNISPSKRIFS
ncbi:CD48 antigen-like [Carassius auratus]|uniref:CD48 antigen-like n=1 Tax=Carassius auratus TaxID=7957 RepID=A0A6P6Q4K5_CARAU|nr:CD48 antigen-like [Carassius auratus]